MSDNGIPFEYYVRSAFGDEIREVSRQVGDVTALQRLQDEVLQQHRPALEAVEGELAPTVDRAPTEVIGRLGTVMQTATFCSGAIALWALSVDKANRNSETPRSIMALRQEYVEQRHNHWGVRPDGYVVEGQYDNGEDNPAYVQARHDAKEFGVAALFAEYQQVLANLDSDAQIVNGTFAEGPSPGLLRGLVVYGVLPLQALAAWPGVELTRDEWETYLIQRLTPAKVFSPTANSLPLFTDIPPEFRETLLNDPDVMAAVAAGLDVNAEQGRHDGRLLAELSFTGEGEQDGQMWSTYQRLAWVGAYANYAQTHLWNFANVQMSPRIRSYLANFYGTVTQELETDDPRYETSLWEINDRLRQLDIVTGADDPTFQQVFADGLLALSDERIGGGYGHLPEQIRSVAQGDHTDMIAAAEDLHQLSLILDDATLAPGTSFSKHVTIATLQAGQELQNYGEDMAGDQSQQEIDRENARRVGTLSLLEVMARNHQAMHDLITGEGMDNYESVSQGTEDGTYGSYDEVAFLRKLYTTAWPDNGEVPYALVDWIADEHHGLDGQLADEAFARWADIMASTGSGGLYDIFVHTDELESRLDGAASVEAAHLDDELPSNNRTIGALNPELAKSISNILGSYLDVISNYSGDPSAGGQQSAGAAAEDGELDTGEKVRLMTLAVTTDGSAELLAQDIIGTQAANMATVTPDGVVDAAARNARLQAYFDAALNNEAMTRTANEVAAENEAADRRNAIMRIAASVVRSFNPIDFDYTGWHLRAWQEQMFNAFRYGATQAYVESHYQDPTAVLISEPHADLTNNDPSEFKFKSTYDLLHYQINLGAIDPATLPPSIVSGDPPTLRLLEDVAPADIDRARAEMQDALLTVGIDADAFNGELWDTYGMLRERYSMDASSIDAFNTGGSARNF